MLLCVLYLSICGTNLDAIMFTTLVKLISKGVEVEHANKANYVVHFCYCNLQPRIGLFSSSD
jgi:hypothetical protein